MNKNALIPFALIAVLGIGLMFVLGFVGLDNMEEKANGGEEKPGETAEANPEDIFAGNCAACHGADLSGGMGPALKGTAKTVDEITEIITNGKGKMPPISISDDEKNKVATWITEQK